MKICTLSGTELLSVVYDSQGRANLQGANLQGARLQGARLQGANLQGADLQCARLQGADLQCARLQGARLQGANLQGANLQDADLQGADLQGANLQGANLQDADLQCARLQGTHLQGANLQGANLPHFRVNPEEGSYVAFKRIGTCIIKLRIPEEARRTSSLIGRKCRAEFADVLEIWDGSGNPQPSVTGGYANLTYTVGERIYPDKYDEDIREEYTHGIHHFITKREAVEY
jgi:hypothetical protein